MVSRFQSALFIAFIALAIALLANLSGVISNARVAHSNCRAIERLNTQVRLTLERSKSNILKGTLDDDYQRIFGTHLKLDSNGKWLPAWEIHKAKYLENLEISIHGFRPHECKWTIFFGKEL